MDQQTYLALVAMLNSFPQQGSSAELTLRTYETVLSNVLPQAVCEAAMRFTSGEVEGQNRTFAPSIAEFTVEAKRVERMLPYRGRITIARPRPQETSPTRAERIRMKFKMALWSVSMRKAGGAEELAVAMQHGLDDLMALGERWGVEIPDELWKQAA